MALTLISVLTILLTLFYVTVVLFLRRGWGRLTDFNLTPEFKPVTRVSVIVAARNEEENINRTLDDLIAQNYPKELLEIIIVDDHSTDRTSEIISSYAAKGVLLIRLNESEKLNSYKKKAITEAIKVSSSDLIVTTDADCRMNKNWLRTIAGFYQENHCNLISSPVIYFEERNWFERLQSLEFLFLIGLGASSIGNKVPSTCNGANLAYRRDVFFELSGFRGIDDLASGDDELFMHKVASAYPGSIGFCKSSAALVYTHAKSNLREFIRQRKRWASKSTRYKNKGIVALGVLTWLFNVMLLVNTLLGVIYPAYFTLGAGALMVKFSTETFFLWPLCRFIKRINLIRFMPFLTVVHILYMVYIGIAGNSGKYVWKGREVR
ncbi:glycosyltransferase family 2 protein [Rubrolithibacter danxiaensis]|uniref:glycosyltransferase family 2 protein n=1 Tax=Rubrolithibacter danxiaensis TaxID=3390805 RepID=UPI003BF880B0